MSDSLSQTYAQEIVGGVVKVTGGLIGKSLIDGIRKTFTSSSQVQRGDYYMDQSRVLLQNHLQLIELDEQAIIHDKFKKPVRAFNWQIPSLTSDTTGCERLNRH